jgi:hypothetical protein
MLQGRAFRIPPKYQSFRNSDEPEIQAGGGRRLKGESEPARRVRPPLPAGYAEEISRVYGDCGEGGDLERRGG